MWSFIPGALRKTFFQADGSLDEIVLSATAYIISSLVLEFHTFWMPASGPAFNLSDFGEGVMKMAIGIGVWWRLREWVKNPTKTEFPDAQHP